MKAKKLILFAGLAICTFSVSAQQNGTFEGGSQKKEMHEQHKTQEKKLHEADKLEDKRVHEADKGNDNQLKTQRELQKKQMHNNKEALKKQEEIRERQQKLAAKQRKQNLTTRPKRYPPIKYGKIAANNPPVPMMERK